MKIDHLTLPSFPIPIQLMMFLPPSITHQRILTIYPLLLHICNSLHGYLILFLQLLLTNQREPKTLTMRCFISAATFLNFS